MLSVKLSSLSVLDLGPTYPNLIDVDLEYLASGLESGLFTSVDLVNVR